MCNLPLRAGESSAENHDYRRAPGATVDLARAAFRAVGCAAQIELGEIAQSEWKPQVRCGRKRRDVRGLGRRTSARSNDEARRGIHRHRRLHQARLGTVGEAASALDSQVHGLPLNLPLRRSFPPRGLCIEQGETRCPMMVVYVLIAISAIVFYLIILGDGTGRSGRQGR
jgi:hypothetical protein